MPTPVNPTVTLPGGQPVSIMDLVDHEVYATFELPPTDAPPAARFPLKGREMVEVFDKSLSTDLYHGRFAGRADTNLPRPGYGGLPQDWWGLVFGWRAALVGSKADIESRAVERWLEKITARLHFNQKAYADLPLIEILKAPKRVSGEAIGDLDPASPVPEKTPTAEEIADVNNVLRVMKLTIGDLSIPLLLRQNLSYGVRLFDLPPAPMLREPLAIRFFLRGWWRRVVV